MKIKSDLRPPYVEISVGRGLVSRRRFMRILTGGQRASAPTERCTAVGFLEKSDCVRAIRESPLHGYGFPLAFCKIETCSGERRERPLCRSERFQVVIARVGTL